VRQAGVKLTTYFGERDRTAHGFLADGLSEIYERRQMLASILLRGSAGFGRRHELHSDRSLTLSESLPAVSIAVDARERIEQALPEVLSIAEHSLVSLERALVLTDDDLLAPDLASFAGAQAGAVKLTVYGGRGVRAGGQAGYVAAIDAIQQAGAAGASVLLGVDGTLHGLRRRARFFARNAEVPLMVLAIGSPEAISVVLPALAGLIEDAAATVERVEVLSGADEPRAMPSADESGLPIWQKLMVHAEEQAKCDGRPLHTELLLRAQSAGAAGATVLRGVRGFYGDRGPFADRMRSIKRHAPMHTVIVDTPENIRRLWPLVARVTHDSGLVTSELVPAFHRTPAPASGLTWRHVARPWG
jgi:PII-like signaling protein